MQRCEEHCDYLSCQCQLVAMELTDCMLMNKLSLGGPLTAWSAVKNLLE